MKLPLAQGEQTLVVTKLKAPAQLFGTVVSFFALLFIAVALLGWFSVARTKLPAATQPWLPFALIAVEAILAIIAIRACLVPLMRWSATRVILTNQRLIQTRRQSGRKFRAVPLEVISSAEMRQSLWQRLWNCGSLEIWLHNGQKLRVDDIPHVHVFHQILTQYLHRSAPFAPMMPANAERGRLEY